MNRIGSKNQMNSTPYKYWVTHPNGNSWIGGFAKASDAKLAIRQVNALAGTTGIIAVYLGRTDRQYSREDLKALMRMNAKLRAKLRKMETA